MSFSSLGGIESSSLAIKSGSLDKPIDANQFNDHLPSKPIIANWSSVVFEQTSIVQCQWPIV
jgi:hypothetical protein